MSDQNSASAVPPEQPGQPPQLPPPVAPAPAAQAQAPAQVVAPVVVQQQNSNIALWLAVALLAIIAALLAVKQFKGPVNTNSVTVNGLANGGSTTVPPSAPSGGAVVDATRNGGKLILAEMCTLQSDGTARLISAQVDLKRAQDAIGKNPNSKEAKAFLSKLEESTKSLPPHAVIAEIPASVLPDNVTCDDWKQQRAYQLVLGAPKPQTKKS